VKLWSGFIVVAEEDTPAIVVSSTVSDAGFSILGDVEKDERPPELRATRGLGRRWS